MTQTTDRPKRTRRKVEVHPATALAKTELKNGFDEEAKAARTQKQREQAEAEARKMFCEVIAPGAPPEHVALVFHYAKALQLDPLRRQVMLLEMPRKNKELSRPGNDVWEKSYTIVVGVHGLLGKIQRHKEYAGIASAAVFAGEPIRIAADQTVTHEYDPINRPKGEAGSPLGAWATVTRVLNGKAIPHTAWVPFSECVLTTWDKKDPKNWKKAPRELWAKMPAWMNEKCAIAAAIRKAFDDEVGGVHVPEEFGGRTLSDGSVEVDPSMAVPVEEELEVTTLAESNPEPGEFSEAEQKAGLRKRVTEVGDECLRRDRRQILDRSAGQAWIVDAEVLQACGSGMIPLSLETATMDQLTVAYETIQGLNRQSEARGGR